MFTSPSAQDFRARQLSGTTTTPPPPQEPRPLDLILLVDVRLMSFVLRFWGQGESGRSGASGKPGGPRQGSKCKIGVSFLFIGSQGVTGPALCSPVEQGRGGHAPGCQPALELSLLGLPRPHSSTSGQTFSSFPGRGTGG